MDGPATTKILCALQAMPDPRHHNIHHKLLDILTIALFATTFATCSIALAIGREPLSMRLVAAAAIFVLLLWPESLVGPSFQMSFAAVIAIISLSTSGPVRRFLAPREESIAAKWGRRGLMLLVTGMVIEIALMPIVMFHFHRAGIYGALANVLAIPLVTFVSMPLIAIALLLDVAGLGAPAWWLAEKSLELLLAIADFTAAQPGAVKLTPAVPGSALLLFVGGALWLALWRSRARLAGLVPMAAAALLIGFAPRPDVLVSGDGRHVGITTEDGRLVLLRPGSDYARENLFELAGLEGEPVPLESWSGGSCSRDFCVASIERGGRAAAQSTQARRRYSCCSRLIQSGTWTAPGPRIAGSRCTPKSGSVTILRLALSLGHPGGGGVGPGAGPGGFAAPQGGGGGGVKISSSEGLDFGLN